MGLKIGDCICHPKYGEGTVLSVGDFTEVRFSLKVYGVKKFRTSFVENHCIIPDRVRAEDEKDRGIKPLTKESAVSLDDRVLGILKKFQTFKLSDFGLNILRDFFVFKVNYHQGHKRGLRYHLLAQFDNEDEGEKFIAEVKKGLIELGVLPNGAISLTESEFSDKILKNFL